MNKRYQFFTISETSEEAFSRPTFSVTNNSSGTQIGMIGWYPRWKQFVFFAESNTVWSAGCLADVQGFLNALNNPS